MHDGHVLAAGQVQHADPAAHVRRQDIHFVVTRRLENAGRKRAPGREYVIAVQPKVVGKIVGVVPGLVFGQCAYPRLAHRLVGHHVRYGALRQQMAAALQRVRIELRQAQPNVSGPAVLAALDLDEEHLARRQRPFAEHYGVGKAHLPVRHRVLVVQAQVVTVEPVKPRLLISARLLLGHGLDTTRGRGRYRRGHDLGDGGVLLPHHHYHTPVKDDDHRRQRPWSAH